MEDNSSDSSCLGRICYDKKEVSRLDLDKKKCFTLLGTLSTQISKSSSPSTFSQSNVVSFANVTVLA